MTQCYEKYGKKFKFHPFPKPAEEDVVFFSSDEFNWIKEQEQSKWGPCQREEYFIFLWNAKRNDPAYQLIPDPPEENKMADMYSEQIKEMLRGRV